MNSMNYFHILWNIVKNSFVLNVVATPTIVLRANKVVSRASFTYHFTSFTHNVYFKFNQNIFDYVCWTEGKVKTMFVSVA